jgi:hypothetical protein
MKDTSFEKKNAAALPEQPAANQNPQRTYVHEPYDKGIYLPSGRLVRPLEMSDADIETLIQEYPPAASWWA